MQTASHKEEFFAPYEWYRTMRTTEPVFFDKEHQIWHIFNYEDVSRVMNDYATFSSDAQSTIGWKPEAPSPIYSAIIGMDPPRHHQFRKLVTAEFTPRAIAELEPHIAAITQELLANIPDTGEVDILRDLAYPLPVIVIAELLGVPHERRADFKRWSDALTADRRETPLEERQAIYAYFSEVFAERRRHPQSGLIDHLLTAKIDGRLLSEDELLGFCSLLLVAGNETTTNLIGNAILCFDQCPESVQSLRENPALVPAAIEEVLRYLSPVKALTRFTTKATILGGKKIGARQKVNMVMASANRDELQFSRADRFEIRRESNRHLGFGHSIHFCLGAPLARLEAKIALTAMLERFPGSWRVPDVPLRPIKSHIIFGARNLPMIWG